MLQRKGSQWELYPHKVKYIQHEKENEQWALPNKQWWEAFADKWDHTEIIKFTEVDVTEEMQKRFAEVRNMPEDFHHIYSAYVETGEIIEEVPENHPFKLIVLKKENEEQGQINTELNLEVMEQGQRITNTQLQSLGGNQ